ncbi:hypothetical protein CPC08DRAFT_822761 [Agrocybe pediades]|nr:hypothetical protein CPC08DRAFT_822761 [Agrocybe pediades]
MEPCSEPAVPVNAGSSAGPETSELKRKVEEDALPEMPPQKMQREFKRHEVHWIPEGNVLIDIGGVRFKLVRSRLASQSVWFKYFFDAQENGIPDDPPEDFDTDEVQKVLANSQYSDGLPLLFLDQDDDFPSHEEFAALLTAMDNAITYIFEWPPFPVLGKIFHAAKFYRCGSYETQVKRAILDLYPDDPRRVEEHNKSFLVEAAKLAYKYPDDLNDILPSVFYQLTRLTYDGNRKEPVESLTKDSLVLLIILEKQLATHWGTIIEALLVDCQRLPLSPEKMCRSPPRYHRRGYTVAKIETLRPNCRHQQPLTEEGRIVEIVMQPV